MVRLIIAGIVLIVVFFSALVVYQRRPLTVDECYRMSSNDRTRLCLQQFASPEVSDRVPGNKIEIMQAPSDYVNGQFVVNPRLKNNSSNAVNSVTFKISYFDQNHKNCEGDPIDTEIATVDDIIILPGDTKIVSYQASSPISKSKMTYCLESVQARIAL